MQKEISYVDNQIKLAQDFDKNISREFFLTLSYIFIATDCKIINWLQKNVIVKK